MSRGDKAEITSKIARFASMIYLIKELYRVADDNTMNDMTPHIIDTLMVVHYGLDNLFTKIEEIA